MAHLNKLSLVKEHILTKAPLKLDTLEKENLQEKNVDDFLKKFFSTYNRTLNTVYVNKKAVQTKAGLRRSVSDIVLICHYYFPKVSITKTYKRLCRLVGEGIIISAVCDKIHSRVYRFKETYDKSNFFNSGMTDEYGVDFNLYDLDGATFNQDGWGTDYDEDNLNIIKL
jgi:hypothetical protein